jgi:hypothetical protein
VQVGGKLPMGHLCPSLTVTNDSLMKIPTVSNETAMKTAVNISSVK